MQTNRIRSVAYDGFEIKLVERHQLLELFRHNGIFVSVNPLMIERFGDDVRPILRKHTGYIDGIGLCLALWARGVGWSPRIAGSEIWLELINQYPDRRYAIIGGTSVVLEQAVKALCLDHPGLDIAYSRNGFFDMEQELAAVVESLRAASVDVVFLAMGSPRQEVFAQMLFDRYEATYLGIGGSLDVYTSTLRPAPQWVKHLGFEWLWRWALEPIKRTGMNAALLGFVLRASFVPIELKNVNRAAGDP